MGFRRIALSLMLLAVVGAACGGEGDSASVELDNPIGVPAKPTRADGSSREVAVAKAASIHMDVPGEGLNRAAQSIVDIATSASVRGFLVSSVVDLTEAHGFGQVVISVPADRFEEVVAELNEVGDIKRQELEGEDLSPESLSARADLADARAKTADLIEHLGKEKDPAEKFRLRQAVRRSKNELRDLKGELGEVASQTSYSTLEVALAGREPPPPPPEPVFKRAWSMAASISATIASAVLLSLAVIVPIGAVLLLLYLLVVPVLRRARLRFGGRDLTPT